LRPSFLVLFVTLGFCLACAGIGGTAESEFGSVAFQTYKHKRAYLKFKTDSKVEKWWANMVGKPPQGTYVQHGELITIIWDPSFTNHSAREAKLRQLGDCSMAEFWWMDKDGEIHQDDSDMWEQSKPKCPQ